MNWKHRRDDEAGGSPRFRLISPDLQRPGGSMSDANAFRRVRIFPALVSVLLLAACGGGGDGDGNGNGGGDFACAGSGEVAISGTVTYEFVPAVPGNSGGAELDFSAAGMRPVRGAEVAAVCPDGSVTYATSATDGTGAYSLDVPQNVDVAVRVLAK